MKTCRVLSLPFVISLVTTLARAENPAPAADSPQPILRIEAGGPTSFVSALAFSPDGKTLYAAGFDKTVRIWTLNDHGQFVLGRETYRVPVGAGLYGAINALAVSPDGRWLAVGGKSAVRGAGDLHKPGIILPQVGGMTNDMRMDEGRIFIFDRQTQGVQSLRKHLGDVLAMAFAPSQPGKPPLLVSAGREWDSEAKEFVGSIRLWDAAKGSYLDGIWDVSPMKNMQPGLAVWHTGKELKQLSVAIAWEDGRLRCWNVAEGRIYPGEDGKNNNTVVYLREAERLLTGSYMGGRGHLQTWDVSSGGQPQKNSEQQADIPSEDGRPPRALALCSSRTGGRADQAATIMQLRDAQRGDDFQLALIDLRPRSFGTIRARVPLWTVPASEARAKPACLAAVPGGSHVAVAGNKKNEIVVYSIQDLLNRQTQAQALQSKGTNIRDVAFAVKGQSLGLVLNEESRSKLGQPRSELSGNDLIFDFGTRRLTEDKSGWKIDAPQPGDWQPEKVKRRIGLKQGEEITQFALLPTPPGLATPILAVAYLDKDDQPKLGLYLAATGDQLRELTGHMTPIHALAFSSNGRLLASAAEDQIACVWSLTDLDQILKQRGLLHGLTVTGRAAKKVAIAEVKKNSPYFGKVREGEIIEEAVLKRRKLPPLTAPYQFYEAISRVKPGEIVTLRLRDPDTGATRTIDLAVGQGIDERKPLLSFFVEREGKQGAREWIGWSPHGPYDISRPGVDRYVGWHLNTGKPEAPTAFALADQYRKEFYRHDILRHLVMRANLDDALNDWKKDQPPPPQPKMTLRIDEAGNEPRVVGNRILVQKLPIELMAAIDDCPIEEVSSMRWSVDGGQSQDFKGEMDRERIADLSGVNWTRGIHRIRVEVEVRNGLSGLPFFRHLELQYQPPPPIIELIGGGRPHSESNGPLVIHDEPKFRIQARIRPAQKGQEVKVSLSHRHNSKELAGQVQQPRALTIDQELQLQPGINVIRLQADNVGALAGYEEFETRTAEIAVDFIPPKVKVDSPRLSLVLIPQDGDRQTQLEPEKPVFVDVPNVRLRGRIRSNEKLLEATVNGRPFAGFAAGTGGDFSVEEKLDLKPGNQQLRIRARTENSVPAEVNFQIEYRPQLPRLELMTPVEGLNLFEGRDRPEIELKGVLIEPADPQPYQLEILASGGRQPGSRRLGPASTDKERQTFTAKVPLQPAENLIEIRLSSAWRQPRTIERHVWYRRPPRIVKIDEPKPGATPLLDLVAWLESPTELPPTKAEIAVTARRGALGRGGREIVRQLPASALVAQSEKGGITTWKVNVQQVPLERGANEIQLYASNRDGRSLAPGSVKVNFEPPPPPKAVITMLDPEQAVNVVVPKYTVRWRVQSDSPVQSVELLHQGQLLAQEETGGKGGPGGVSPRSSDKASTPFFEREFTRAVALKPDINMLQVRVVNDGGLQQGTAVTVTYVEKPVRVELTKLECPQLPGANIELRLRPDGMIVIPRVPDGRVRLHGQVVWLNPEDRPSGTTLRARLWVNGFQQFPEELVPAADPAVSTFTSDVVLNQAKDNGIRIEVPRLKQDADNRKLCLVEECAKPVEAQRLHLLVVGIGEEDEKKLKDRALVAVQAARDPNSPGRFVSPAFREIEDPIVLNGHWVRSQQVRYALEDIKLKLQRIERGSKADPRSEVFIFYFQGPEMITREGHYFLTSESKWIQPGEGSGIDCKYLASLFAETVGAQIILLDVTRQKLDASAEPGDAQDQIVFWPSDFVGVFRSAWLGPADQPPDVQLITALKDALSRVGILKRVDQEVSLRYDRVKERYAQVLRYHRRVPTELENLMLGLEPKPEVVK
jgi:WD40 repeat protein